jgi:hypothetical protein
VDAAPEGTFDVPLSLTFDRMGWCHHRDGALRLDRQKGQPKRDNRHHHDDPCRTSAAIAKICNEFMVPTFQDQVAELTNRLVLTLP